MNELKLSGMKIQDVVFSHVEKQKKLGKSSLGFSKLKRKQGPLTKQVALQTR